MLNRHRPAVPLCRAESHTRATALVPQQEADVQHGQVRKTLEGYLQTAKEEQARMPDSSRYPVLQVQVDTRRIAITAEDAYYSCKTRRIAQGCQPSGATVENECELCRAAVLMQENLKLGRASGAPPGFQPDMSRRGESVPTAYTMRILG